MANRPMKNDKDESSLVLLRKQRSHVLFVLSNAKAGSESAFLKWYQGAYRNALLDIEGVLSAQHYEQHEVDITQGRYARLPFHFLALYELSVDGAQEAQGLIERITTMHQQQATAEAPATWLYYPLSEKVGRAPSAQPSMIVLAFANGLPGQESEFREWYATRHIRHALNIPALVSGQCFERTQFQQPGTLEAKFAMIAIYEQQGTPQDIFDSFASIPLSKFDFPALDVSRFAEWIYRPL